MTETTQVFKQIFKDAPVDLTELMERISSGYVLIKAGEAHSYLVKIITECLKQQSASAKIVCKDVANEYNVSQPTMCHWNRKLVKSGLVTYRRQNKALLYTPATFINPSDIFRNFIVDEVRNRSDAMFGDLFARVRELELVINS